MGHATKSLLHSYKCGHPAAVCMTAHICGAPVGHSSREKKLRDPPPRKKKRQTNKRSVMGDRSSGFFLAHSKHQTTLLDETIL